MLQDDDTQGDQRKVRRHWVERLDQELGRGEYYAEEEAGQGDDVEIDDGPDSVEREEEESPSDFADASDCEQRVRGVFAEPKPAHQHELGRGNLHNLGEEALVDPRKGDDESGDLQGRHVASCSSMAHASGAAE